MARAYEKGSGSEEYLYAQIEHAVSLDSDGWIALRLQCEQEEAAGGYLLSFRTQVKILEPRALREMLLQLAQSVVAFYAQ
ncbi:MAG TPA: WYL domain-containing protein [Ktedonobacteraceae bacterium]|nr:WYL domain-containing protein [Ktedonobacteraceae bacterium]